MITWGEFPAKEHNFKFDYDGYYDKWTHITWGFNTPGNVYIFIIIH